MYYILWTDACDCVNDIIFVLCVVLIFHAGTHLAFGLHLAFGFSYNPLPGLPNGHYALYLLGFMVAAGSALRPFTVSHLAPSTVDYYLTCLYVCLCGTNILCRYPFSLWATFSLRALIQPTSRATQWALCPVPSGFRGTCRGCA